MKTLRVGIDIYGLDPLQLGPLEVLEWARDSGAEDVQFSGLNQEQRQKIDRSYQPEGRHGALFQPEIAHQPLSRGEAEPVFTQLLGQDL